MPLPPATRVLLPLALTLALPPAANAAVTASSINQPADPATATVDLRNGATAPQITVSGSATAGPGDTLDIVCSRKGWDRNVSGSVPVVAGKFTVKIARD